MPVEDIYTITQLFVREEMLRIFYSQFCNVTLPGNVPLPSDTLLGKAGNHCLWNLAKNGDVYGVPFFKRQFTETPSLYVFVDMFFVGRCEVALNWKSCCLREC